MTSPRPDPERHGSVYANFQQAVASTVVIIFILVCAWNIPQTPVLGVAGVIGGVAALWLIDAARRRWFP